MGNFLVAIPTKAGDPGARELFCAGLEASQELRSQPPNAVIESDWAFAASFTRLNGSGGNLVTDPATGSWILASGVWFHRDSFASGEESKLLRRFLEVDAVQLGRELEGFFVVVIGDGRRREVVLITDVIGSRHCFRRADKAGVLFSGSSLLLASIRDSTSDLAGCQEFLSTGIIFEDRTCHNEVRKIGPATVVRVSGTSEKTQQYWSPTEAAVQTIGGNHAVDALWHSLTQAAKKIHRLCPNPVCDLTGGYDSRAIVAAFVGADVRCATVVSGPDGSPDVVVSEGLAKAAGLPHLHQRETGPFSCDELRDCVALTDGEYDLLKYASIRKSHLELAASFDISVNGSFGEVARGYWWELLLPRIGAHRPLNAHRLASRRYGALQFETSLFPPDSRLDLIDHLTGVILRTNSGLQTFANTFQLDHTYLKMRMQRWQGRIASSTNQIWPCVSPFMFRSVLEIMLGTAPILRWRSLLTRKMLARFSPRMAAYPLEHGYPAEPANWSNLHKFAPLATYFGHKILHAASLPGAKSADRDASDRLDLWREEKIKDLLDVRKMKTAAFLDPAALRAFVDNSKQQSFAFGDQWSRLLTLEWALRLAAKTRKTSVPAFVSAQRN